LLDGSRDTTVMTSSTGHDFNCNQTGTGNRSFISARKFYVLFVYNKTWAKVSLRYYKSLNLKPEVWILFPSSTAAQISSFVFTIPLIPSVSNTFLDLITKTFHIRPEAYIHQNCILQLDVPTVPQANCTYNSKIIPNTQRAHKSLSSYSHSQTLHHERNQARRS
jgi:hypothetical protein